MANFKQNLVTGHQTECIIANRIQKLGCQVKKAHHEKYPYDLITKRNDIYKRVEVKSFGDGNGTTDACFELTNKYGHLAEYLQYADQIDYLIRYNWCTDKAYIMDFKVLAPLLIKAATVKNFGRHMMPVNCSHIIRVGGEGSFGIVMSASSPVIGFKKELL
jgi:hypothetical protein